MSSILERVLVGIAVASVIALLSRRRGSLSTSGAWAAVAVGTGAVAGGWGWGALLVLYFVTSTALSHFHASEKQARTGSVIAKGGARDATQVMANGGIFATCAVLTLIRSHELSPMLTFAGLGALAASAADTWATEIGTWIGGAPRSILTGRAVEPGTSGGITVAGLVAMVCGAGLVAAGAAALGIIGSIAIIAGAGVCGALADSVLGATLQGRRWCDACARATEQHVHECGSATSRAGGFAWLDNDLVNLFATIVGAVVASLLALSSFPP